MALASSTLRRAASLIREKGWTQNAAARDALGFRIEARHPNAACFCSIGAIEAVVGRGPHFDEARLCLALAVARHSGTSDVFVFNDDPTRTVVEVLRAFETAVAMAEEVEARS